MGLPRFVADYIAQSEAERHDLLAAFNRRLTSNDTTTAALPSFLAVWEGKAHPTQHQRQQLYRPLILRWPLPASKTTTHGGFFEDGQLIRNAALLKGIPAVIIQGRYDMCTPARSAWEPPKLGSGRPQRRAALGWQCRARL